MEEIPFGTFPEVSQFLLVMYIKDGFFEFFELFSFQNLLPEFVHVFEPVFLLFRETESEASRFEISHQAMKLIKAINKGHLFFCLAEGDFCDLGQSFLIGLFQAKLVVIGSKWILAQGT